MTGSLRSLSWRERLIETPVPTGSTAGDETLVVQASDFRRRKTQALAEHLIGVLAKARRGDRAPAGLAGNVRDDAGCRIAVAAWMVDLAQVRGQAGIAVHGLAQRLVCPVRHPRAVKQRGEFAQAPARERRLEQRIEPVAPGEAQALVGGEGDAQLGLQG